jgi:hypothetical protein
MNFSARCARSPEPPRNPQQNANQPSNGRSVCPRDESQVFEFVGIAGGDRNAIENIIANDDAAILEHLSVLLEIIRVRRNQPDTTLTAVEDHGRRFLISSPVLQRRTSTPAAD